MTARSLLLVTLAIAMLAIPSTARAGANPDFTIPLHAMEGEATSCDDYLPVDCVDHRPDVNVPPDRTITVFVFIANHIELHGMQTAFDWDPSWSLVSGHFECQGHQLSLTTPQTPGGPGAGDLVTAFDCVIDPALAVIGYVVFNVGSQGCLSQVNPAAPRDVAALDCQNLLDQLDASNPIQQLRLGRICVGNGGHDACDPLATPVESATWGKVKATYR